jgi:hypothetical protein
MDEQGHKLKEFPAAVPTLSYLRTGEWEHA